MAPFDPRALRQIIRYLDETAAAGYHRDPAVAYRLGVMNRRARAVPVQREEVDDEGIGPILRRWY